MLNRLPRPTLRTASPVILAATAVVAMTVSVLADVPERVPFGHETGIVLSSLSFAYLGAWIFNFLIVETPRRAELTTAYDGAWRMLTLMANDGQALLNDLEPMAYGWVGPSPRTAEDLQKFCSAVWLGDQRSRWGGGSIVLNPAKVLRWRLERHQTHMESIAPFVHLFDAEVAVVLMKIRTSENATQLLEVPSGASVLTVHVTATEDTWTTRDDRQTLESRGNYVALASYVLTCLELRAAMANAQPQRRIDGYYISLATFNVPAPWQSAAESVQADYRLLPVAEGVATRED